MTNLSINEKNGVLVVDSRLVTQELGVNHGDWFRNIVIKYRQEIEGDFGVFRFENAKPIKASHGGRPEQFAFLTEAQATVLMTYSRNTAKVRRCKRRLVKAFTEARKLLEKTKSTQRNQESNIAALPSAREKLENIRLGMELMSELGGCDERTQILIKEQARNILCEEKLQASSRINKYPVAMYSIGRSSKV